jgi:hypothetical protein
MKYEKAAEDLFAISGLSLNLYARSENRTRTGFPTRPSNVRVYQFRHPSLKRTCDYFAGEDAGLGEAAGLAAAEGEAAGLAVGAAAGFEAGVGCGAAPSSITERVPIPGSSKISARNIKIIAATTVAFSSGF